jgi:uncharacterized protein (DUF433 family)
MISWPSARPSAQSGRSLPEADEPRSLKTMGWQDYIHSDPEVLLGKPVVKGTRLSVEFLLGLCAAGWTQEQILDNYPSLTPDALRAVFAFAAEAMQEESLYTVRLRTA